MSWLRVAGNWCSLGVAVGIVGAGAIIGEQYTEKHMLATVLGKGATSASFDVHWSQAAACAQDIEIPLPTAKDNANNALRLRADKLWLAFDKDSLLRKRLNFPHVVIEDAVISPANLDGLAALAVVDLPSGSGTDMEFTAGPIVELEPAADPSDSAASSSQEPAASSNKVSLVWLEQLSQLTKSLSSERFAAGRQVAVDTDMLTEQVQAQFEAMRQQSLRLIAEARDIQMQLTNLDNLLRQEDQFKRSYVRLEQIAVELKQQRSGLNMLDKRLTDLQSNLRAQTLEEKQELMKMAASFQSPDASQVSSQLLEQCIRQALVSPNRYSIVLADLVRKPYAYGEGQRGKTLRGEETLPELAAQSTKIRGTLAIDGHSRPFDAQGRFLLTSTSVAAERDSTTKSPRTCMTGTDQWQMSIEQDDHCLKLEAHSLVADGSVAIHLTSSSDEQLEMDCRVCAGQVAANEGRLQLPHWLGSQAIRAGTKAYCETLSTGDLMAQCAEAALVADDSTPEQINFSCTSAVENEAGQITIDKASTQWLKGQLEEVATRLIVSAYESAIANLDQLMTDKLNQQRTLLATLRRDAQQHLEDQFDQLRRIQSAIDSVVEQRTGGYMAKQRPGHLDR